MVSECLDTNLRIRNGRPYSISMLIPYLGKKILREKLFLVIIITYFNSIVVLMIAYQDVIIFSGFEHNTQLLIFIIIKTIFLSIDG